MGGEVYAWPEGAIYLVTGTTTAEVGYAEDTDAALAYGVDNYATLDGTYHNLVTGRRADVYVNMYYSTDFLALQKIASAQTAVHLHFRHTANGVSGGVILYSGAIDQVRFNGRAGQLFRGGLDYHANIWSAY